MKARVGIAHSGSKDARLRPRGLFFSRVVTRRGMVRARPAIKDMSDLMFRTHRRRNEERNGRKARRCIPFLLETLEPRVLLTNYVVTSTSDTPVAATPDVPNPLTLRQAITEADADSGPDTISFDFVPKNIPGVVNFDLTNQVWTIDVNNNVLLPPITGLV
jgi:hypothetical protein